MLNLLKRLVKEEEGQGLTEYALVLGVIAIACIAAITLFSEQIAAAWNSITTNLGAAVKDGTVPKAAP